MPKKYRLITQSVEAILLAPESFERAQMWCGGAPVTEIDAVDSKKKFVALNIPTIDGVVRVGEGEYLVKDPNGRFSKMSKDEFEAKYELV